MKIREIIAALENFAPLPLQDGFDNAGLQIGLTETEASGALLCLDVTEAVIDEAVSLGINLIVSHHPLLFKPLSRISDCSYEERCAMKAIQNGIVLYAAHTNLDNAKGGVNYAIADKLGLTDLQWLEPKSDNAGSGLIGILSSEISEEEFLCNIKSQFALVDIHCNAHFDRPIKKVALCGGAGAFLIPAAYSMKADAFVTGEIGYHRFFGYDNRMLLCEIGHFESEQYTVDLLGRIIGQAFPDLRIEKTKLNTNPIRHY